MSFYGRYAGIFGGGGGGGGGAAPLAEAEPIPNGADTVAVTFATAFGAAPVVVAWLTSSDPTPDILGVIGISVTTSGFTANISNAAPNGNYSLNWMASSVNN